MSEKNRLIEDALRAESQLNQLIRKLEKDHLDATKHKPKRTTAV